MSDLVDGLEGGLEGLEDKFDSYRRIGVNIPELINCIKLCESAKHDISDISAGVESSILSSMDAILFRHYLNKSDPELFDKVDKMSKILSDYIIETVMDYRETGE